MYSADPASAAFDAMTVMAPVERRVIDAPPRQACVAAATDSAATEMRHELVLVDTRVTNWQGLVDDIRRARGADAEIVILDPARDGIEQISERLAQEHGLDAVHIISHAEPGAMQIGATRLDFATLLDDATAISRWRQAFNTGADLLLYGCDLAATDDGRSLVDALSRLTGADVAASTDVTGGTSVGGDWVLEYTTGSIQSEALANASDLAAWDGSLGITSPGTETRANTSTTGAQTTWPTRRDVAIDGSGNFVVVWNDGNSSDIYARRYDSAGSPLSTQFRVNTNTSSQDERAVVAMNASGAFVVVWQSDSQDPDGSAGIYAQAYDASGAAVGGEFRVNQTTSNGQLSPSASMDAAGNFVVSWTSTGQDSGSTYGVYARRFGATGTALGNEFLVNTTKSGDQEASSVAVNTSGDFVIAWQSTSGQDGNGAGVYAMCFNSAGVAQTGELLVNTSTAGDQLRPSVAIAANGDFMVTWSGAGTGGVGSDAYGQRFNSAGVKQGGEVRLASTTTDEQDYPVVAADSNGNFLVTWESYNQDGSGWGVYGRLLRSSGSFLTNETLINTTTSGDQAYPSVAWNGTQAVFLWEGNGSGDSSGVFFKTFDVTVPGATVSAISGNTTEAGGTASFSVVLNSQPTADVTISIASSDTTEGTVSVSSLTFTAGNWNLAQVVTVTGVDDAVDDGDATYSIVTGAAVSADANYNGMAVAGVAATNIDNDIAGVSVSAISGNTTEAGGTATFSVVLTSQPTADVVISVASSDATEGTTSSLSLTFTSTNWNVAQVVTITGVDDTLDDGDIAYSIATGAAASADTSYNGMAVDDLSATNVDNDTAGINVAAISGNTTEAGGTATFGVVLTSQPTADVTIAIASSDATEGTTSTSSLTFTAANWNAVQTVTVTGVDDAVDDGNATYSVVTGTASSADPGYGGMAVADVAVTNVDNDTAGTSVSTISGSTTEAGGSASFSVMLTSQPTADVTIAIASSDTTEGTVSTSSLTFTAANWNVAQVATVTGADDAIDDGDVGYSIVTGDATSGDAIYSGMNAADVAATNVDNDTAGITVSAISANTSEAGGIASFSAVLTSQPTADVTISVASDDTTEGTVSTSSLTFTAANWNVAQVVTVTGVDDAVDDGDVAYSIATGAAVSADTSYNGMAANDLSTTNIDNDIAGVTVSPISGNTMEAGGMATFGVALASQPTADVTISIASNNTAEGTVSTSSLTFTSANWNVAQLVTVTSVDDAVDDGDVAYSVITGAAVSADASYNGMVVDDVALSNVDNDSAGISVSTISGNTTEAGSAATFSIVLTSQPTADVTISLASSNTGEGSAAVPLLTFTAANWNVAQAVTVTGVDDAVDDGDVAYSIGTGPAVSADSNYSGHDAADVGVTNLDDDTAGVSVSAISGSTTEAGGSASFTVAMNSQPTADVTISIASGDTTEGTVSVSSLTFTAADWNIARTVTVIGVDDADDDGNVAFSIVAVASSGDLDYDGLDANVTVTNIDDDTAGVTVTPTTGLQTTESGATASFSVALTSRPASDVTITVASNNTAEGTTSVSSLTFSAADWNVAQVVTITGVDDAVDDGNIVYGITTGAATSVDAKYAGLDASDVVLTNVDDDTAAVVVSPISGDTTEAGGVATFTIVLASQPTADVEITLSSSDPTEGAATMPSVVFTAANWDIAQTVTVTGADDAVDDGDVAYSIVTDAAVSADANYNGMAVAGVAATNIDNDTAGVSVSAISGNTSEAGASATFGVVLSSQPTADVTIAIASNDTAEGSVSSSSLTFTAANWNVTQVVAVTGVDDAVDDGDVAYSIVTGAASGADALYSGINVADVAVMNLDDDTAGVSVSAIGGNTTEATGTATFNVVLTSQPTADVTISIASNDTTEGTVSSSSLTFTAANWNVAQAVTVTGVDDAIDDGDIGYSVVTGAATSADGNYSGIDAADVAVVNVDNDTAGFVVSPITGSTSEAGGSATFSVALTSQPIADVTISLATSNGAEGNASVASVTFTAANWNVAQAVTVTGADDAVDDGDVAYSIVTGAAVSADTNYNGADAADVATTNVDNDTAGISVSAISGNTTEAGGTATFNIVLDSQPTADVTISIASSDTTEGTVSVSSLTFSAANWNVAQVVTVAAVDDALSDGDIAYSIATGAAVSADGRYGGIAVSDVGLTNVDDERAPIVAFPGSLLVNEDTPLQLGTTGVSVADANGDLTRIDLTVAHGGLAVDLSGGASIIAASADHRGVGLAGTQAQLADALARITYQGDVDWFGTDTLTISAADASGLQVGSSVAIQVSPVNDAPVITSASHVDIPEGQVSVTRVTSMDAEADVPHYTIVGGADAAQFVIDNDSGELRLRDAPDAEAPTDSDHDNVYEALIEVSDGHGAAHQSFAVAVLGVNEAPTVSVTGVSVPLDGSVTLNQRQIVAHDVDSPVASLTFSVNGVVNGHFELAGQPGTAVSNFSQSALQAGLVIFVHDSGTPAPQFVITVSDGQASSAALLVRTTVNASEPAPTHRGGIANAPPSEAVAPAPTSAAGTDSAPASAVVASRQPSRAEADFPRPAGQIDESVDAVRVADSVPKAFVSLLPAPTNRSGEEDEFFWRRDDLRRSLFALSDDVDSRVGKEPEGSDRPRLELANDQETDAVHLELGTVILQTLGVALTAGSVWWALRATGLVAALLASLPAWRQFDCLPVLAEEEDDDTPHWSPAEDAEAARDEAAVERDLFVEGVAR